MTKIVLSDLPDVPLRVIFKYLSDLDIYNLGQAGNSHLYDIASRHIELGKLDYLYYFVSILIKNY